MCSCFLLTAVPPTGITPSTRSSEGVLKLRAPALAQVTRRLPPRSFVCSVIWPVSLSGGSATSRQTREGSASLVSGPKSRISRLVEVSSVFLCPSSLGIWGTCNPNTLF